MRRGPLAHRDLRLARPSGLTGQGAGLLLWLAAGLLLSACSGSVEEEALPFSVVSTDREVQSTGTAWGDYATPSAGTAEASWCSEGIQPLSGRTEGGASELTKVALYQGVEVELGAPESVDVVAGRDALIRVFVAPEGAALNGAVLRLESAAGEQHVFEDLRDLSAPSHPGDLDSTYHFFVPGSLIQTATRLTVRSFRQGRCSSEASKQGARFPEAGSYPLGAREVGGLQVVVVPVTYDADGSERSAALLSAELQELGSQLEALAPVSSVELIQHQPVTTREASLEGILAELMHLRSLERPPSQTIYFGFVRPAPTMAEYCKGSCVAGVSAVGSASGQGSTGIGVAFEETRVETFVHEMGHILRLDHAPCGAPTGVDPQYPHPDGQLGTWGFDMRSAQLIDPAARARDFMSYCDPTWISDFNYQKLLDRIAFANAQRWSGVLQIEPEKPGTRVPLGQASRGEAPVEREVEEAGEVDGEATGSTDVDAVDFVSCLHRR